MTELATLATPLLRATAKARTLANATLVIKLGGSAMEDPVATAGTLDSIAALHQLGLRTVILHGGGKPIDRAMAAEGIEVKKVQGRRYTDEATLQIVVAVLGEIAEGLADELEKRGIAGFPMHDPEVMPVQGERLTLDGTDLGHVGQPTSINTVSLTDSMDGGMIPIIPSLALDRENNWLNVNADTVASAVAGYLQAGSVYFLTDTPGVLANRHDPASLHARLTVAQCKSLIASGVIEGGMIPKVEACFEALDAGAKRAVILDGRNPHSLLSEFVSDTVLGTEILP